MVLLFKSIFFCCLRGVAAKNIAEMDTMVPTSTNDPSRSVLSEQFNLRHPLFWRCFSSNRFPYRTASVNAARPGRTNQWWPS